MSIFVLEACTLFVNDGLSADPTLPGTTELQQFQRTFMASFDMANTAPVASARVLTPFGSPAAAAPGSRATVPIFGATSITLPTGAGTVTGSKADYPEPGQSSSWTISKDVLPNIFKVVVVTAFPAYDIRATQTESYLIRDKGAQDADFAPNGVWTTADLVVDTSGNQNDAYRLGNRLVYRDGSYQDEVITSVKKPTTAGNMLPGFAAWDVTAALDYPALFAPVIDATASYSSTVAYTRNFTDAPAYSFWAGNRGQSIVGVRYYTEHLNAAKTQLIADMVLFEKAVTTYQTTSGDFATAASSLFLPAIGSNPNPTLLAQSFLRQRVVYAWNDTTKLATYSSASRDTRMKTTVVDISTKKDMYITRVNNDAALLTTGDASITIPSGDATEVLASTPAAAVDVKATNLSIKTGDLTPVSITSSTPTGDLGTLYVSLENGSASNSLTPSSDIAGDLTGTTDIKQFSGKQGITVVPASLPAAYTASGDVSAKGTVQAWVYLNAQSDTAGIVHCGTRADFYDEVWSLQFMGASGQVGMSLSTNDGANTASKYTYDWVGSTFNLNIKKWYYLVATWDRSLGATNSYIKVYINGALNKTGTMPKCTKAGAAFGVVNPPVLVGSQFYDSTKVLSGYYGFNGKINGVQVATTVWTDADVLNFYNANSAKTAAW